MRVDLGRRSSRREVDDDARHAGGDACPAAPHAGAAPAHARQSSGVHHDRDGRGAGSPRRNCATGRTPRRARASAWKARPAIRPIAAIAGGTATPPRGPGGGFDRMTAQPGGVWDTLLAEARRFRITSTSDSHRTIDMGGANLRPRQYSKIYVLARHDSADPFDGLRNGHMFAVTGTPIDTLDLQVDAESVAPATMGGTLQAAAGAQLTVRVAVTGHNGANFNGVCNAIDHIDVIAGQASAAGTPDRGSRPATASHSTLRCRRRRPVVSSARAARRTRRASRPRTPPARIRGRACGSPRTRRSSKSRAGTCLWPGGLPPVACVPSATARTRGSAKSGM